MIDFRNTTSLGFHPDGDFKAAGINHSYLSWIALHATDDRLAQADRDAIPVLDERSASFFFALELPNNP